MGGNSRYLCGGGAFGQEAFEAVHHGSIPLCEGLNAAIRKVSDPASKAQFAGCLAGPLPETHSLDTTFDERM